MIHELLVKRTEVRLPYYTYIELLIGGPNQSHKVNFKELPEVGKSSIRNYRFASVNTFFELFLKNFRRNFSEAAIFLRNSLRCPAFFIAPSAEGSADNETLGPGLKKFFQKSDIDSINIYTTTTYKCRFFHFSGNLLSSEVRPRVHRWHPTMCIQFINTLGSFYCFVLSRGRVRGTRRAVLRASSFYKTARFSPAACWSPWSRRKV